MSKILVKRGTRSQINTAAGSSGLSAGEPYLLTDENRIALGTANNAYCESVMLNDLPGVSVFSTTLATGVGTYLHSAHLKPGGGTALTGNRIILSPYFVKAKISVTAAGVYVSTLSSGSKIRIALYKIASNGGLGDIVLDSGDISGGATGYAVGTFSSTVIMPGLYHSEIISDSTPSVLFGTTTGEPTQYGLGGSGGSVAYFMQNISSGWTGLPVPPSSGWSRQESATLPLILLRP